MNQLKRQESKNIVIVGGGSSLGYELIQDLKSSSNKFIIVTSREQLPFDQKNITIITSTLKNSKEVSRVCALIKEIFLDINVIFFNIGGGLGLSQAFLSFQTLQKLMWYNLGVIQEFNRRLKNYYSDDTRILCVGSVATKQITASLGYTIAKVSLETYVRSMSKELAPKNIHIIAISLGAFYLENNAMYRLKANKPEVFERYVSERLPRKKMGSREEILPFLKFLFIEDVGMFSGSVISMDGGEKIAL